MTLRLIRIEYRDDGIFSELRDENGKVLAHTLEHSYLSDSGDYKPKLYDGTFTCVRGMHRLASMTISFETFEITGVEGHTNILFHQGNWQNDSEGCVLLGGGIAPSSKGQMITLSRDTFMEFMTLTKGLDSFALIVSE